MHAFSGEFKLIIEYKKLHFKSSTKVIFTGKT